MVEDGKLSPGRTADARSPLRARYRPARFRFLEHGTATEQGKMKVQLSRPIACVWGVVLSLTRLSNGSPLGFVQSIFVDISSTTPHP